MLLGIKSLQPRSMMMATRDWKNVILKSTLLIILSIAAMFKILETFVILPCSLNFILL